MNYTFQENLTIPELLNLIPSFETALQPFREKIIIIKMGGSLMDNPKAIENLALDTLIMKRFGLLPIIVNGGGKAINRALNDNNPLKIAGYRVTDEKTAIIINSVLAEVSKNIANEIEKYSEQIFSSTPTTLQGCQIFQAKPRDVFLADGSKADLKFVGKAIKANTQDIAKFLAENKIPIISSTALGLDQKIYNCNADDVASALAIAIKASNLIFLTEANGIFDEHGETFSELSEIETLTMIKNGTLSPQILPKLEGVLDALRGNVPAVSVIDGRTDHAVLLELLNHTAKDHLGTHFYKN